jgi:hypothetical protein
MPQSPGSRPSNWQAESFRLSVFLVPSVRANAERWWTRVAGADPENRNAKPARGELIESGFLGGNVLTLSVQPGRIDWFLTPNIFPEGDDGSTLGIKSVGPFESTCQFFLRTLITWLNDCPAIVRLAFGAVLLEPVDNRQAGYLRIAEYLPAVKIDPTGSEDFFYQINRPRESRAVRGLRLNRLSKWSVSSYQPLNIAIGLPVGQPGQPLVHSHGGTPAIACRAEFDLSTPGGVQDPLPHETLPSIFEELVTLGADIAQQGDFA